MSQERIPPEVCEIQKEVIDRLYEARKRYGNPRERFGLIDFPKLLALLQMKNLEELQVSSREWVRDAIGSRNLGRDTKWTESIAVGTRRFVEATKKNLDTRAINRKVTGKDGIYELREPVIPYRSHFDTKKAVLTHENTYP